jgi:adenine-specific DNA-methyltransferase
MTEKQTVQIAEAKGRPMLLWVGKRSLDYVTAFPAQLVETFNPTGEETDAQGLLFHGDNKDVLAWLLAHGYRGKVNLIYIDPPFDSGANYVRQVQLRGVRRTVKLAGEGYTLGEQIQYTDIWANDTYLQFMYERLLLLKELLADDGFIVLHSNFEKSAYLRLVLEEVFGPANFKNMVIVEKSMGKSINVTETSKALNSMCDVLLIASKDPTVSFKTPRYDFSGLGRMMGEFESLSLTQKMAQYWKKFDNAEEDAGGRYYWAPFEAQGTRPNQMYELFGHRPIAGRCWMWEENRGRTAVQRYEEGERLEREIKDPELLGEKLRELARQGVLHNPGNGKPKYKIYVKDFRWAGDLWPDVGVNDRTESYPTSKSPRLISRIVECYSKPGDLVLDCFVGSGTTAAVAQKLGRRWIVADINKGAIQTTSKRLQTIIRKQIEAGVTPPPAALSFSVYRVNDYDLQIQHNEAVNLVVEHIGIERTKTDIFFDGMLGKRLVKIVPFNHPLTLLDLQLLQDELKARPDEERNVVVVCLGKETAVDSWLEDYNKHRPVNKIEVIELRTDQKYGKFFVHQPAQAQVHIERQDGKIVVEIEDFISPTIVERLEMDTPLFKAHIPDWRAMVDVVLIDTAYDGEVFNITLSDVPERKNDLVSGRYELAAPEGKTTVAVKIIDMLGEEVLVTAEV